MLNDCYPAQRCRDLLSLFQWLKSCGFEEIDLIANKRGVVPASFAAIFEPSISTASFIEAPESFHQIAMNEFYQWPLSSFVPGILEYLDLPDVYRSLEKRMGVRFIDA